MGNLTSGMEEVMREQGMVWEVIDEETGLGIWTRPRPEQTEEEA